MGTLWIVGMMGTGKSTVAPLVAAALGRGHVDTDEEVERVTGRSIPDLMDDEARFRSAEAEVVHGLAGSDLVVACGGGAILDGGSRDLMRETGVVIWLRAPIDVLAARVGAGEGRPLLGEEVVAALENIERRRRAAYEDSAHASVSAVGDPETVAERIVEAWNLS